MFDELELQYGGKGIGIQSQQAKYDNEEDTWFPAVKQFSDWTEEEFAATMLHSTFLNPSPMILSQALRITRISWTLL